MSLRSFPIKPERYDREEEIRGQREDRKSELTVDHRWAKILAAFTSNKKPTKSPIPYFPTGVVAFVDRR